MLLNPIKIPLEYQKSRCILFLGPIFPDLLYNHPKYKKAAGYSASAALLK